MNDAQLVTATPVNLRIRFQKGLARFALGLLSLLLVAALGGITVQVLAEARDRANFPPPGRLVDAGGYQLHLNVQGEQHGGATVVLDAAAYGFSAQWGWVQPQVARFARVVSYDRPGLGWSDLPPRPRDAQQRAEELRRALRDAGLPGPYVLVGHSMGSLFVRTFAKRYPREVAGMVLVEPRRYEAGETDEPGTASSGEDTLLRLGPVLARVGVARLAGSMFAENLAQLPEREAAQGRAVLASSRYWSAMLPDVRAAEDAVLFLRPGEDLGDLPLVVLSADELEGWTPQARRRFTDIHTEMARTLSRGGEHRVVQGAGHASLVTSRDFAPAVARAVRQVYEAAKTRTR